MSEYTPDNWVVLKVKEKENTAPLYKVLAGWGSDNWRINSGIINGIEDGDYYEFYGESGSCYRCHKKDYGLRMNTQGVYKKLWIQQEFDDQITLMPEDTNWFKELPEEKTMYKDIFKEAMAEAVMIEELDIAIELAELESDEVILEALHKVRAYFSVPGTYLEGKHDGE